MTPHDTIVVHVDADLEPLMPFFLSNQQKALVAMQAALQQQDYEAIQNVGHGMKGSGGGYGFDILTEIGSALEEAAKASHHEEIATRLSELAHYLGHVEVVYDG